MSVASQNILDRALNLSDADKAFIIDQLRASLDQRYEAIDAQWGREAEQRVEDYKAGRLSSVSMEQLLAKYD
ncbi:MAG: addiction module protein [Dehalococcoidia bacterium]|jgi:putative addiction module component (TIGR02574 family)|nr:addiction module protein [Dehalococcoidia bacterium]